MPQHWETQKDGSIVVTISNDNVNVVDLRKRLEERQLFKIPIVSNSPLEWQTMCWPTVETQKIIRNRGRKRLRLIMLYAHESKLDSALKNDKELMEIIRSIDFFDNNN